jgi:uncharacterized membrane protein HdeD (DUF308 family)
MDGIINLATRLFVRSARIVCGMIIAVIGFIMISYGWDYLSAPLASSSFISLVGGLFLLGIGLTALVWAWMAAFGEGPKT